MKVSIKSHIGELQQTTFLDGSRNDVLDALMVLGLVDDRVMKRVILESVTADAQAPNGATLAGGKHVDIDASVRRNREQVFANGGVARDDFAKGYGVNTLIDGRRPTPQPVSVPRQYELVVHRGGDRIGSFRFDDLPKGFGTVRDMVPTTHFALFMTCLVDQFNRTQASAPVLRATMFERRDTVVMPPSRHPAHAAADEAAATAAIEEMQARALREADKRRDADAKGHVNGGTF